MRRILSSSRWAQLVIILQYHKPKMTKRLLVLMLVLVMMTSASAELWGTFTIFVDINSVTAPALADRLGMYAGIPYPGINLKTKTPEVTVYGPGGAVYFIPASEPGCGPGNFDKRIQSPPVEFKGLGISQYTWTFDLDQKETFPRKVCLMLNASVNTESSCNIYAEKRIGADKYPYSIWINTGTYSSGYQHPVTTDLHMMLDGYCPGWRVTMGSSYSSFQTKIGILSPNLFYTLGTAIVPAS